ncbi:hypothetical protein GCM10010975_31360 [Comamonas phosphati]|nr:hypothetical protein GCM10010975_31360 [Comamonas phosphati]
MTCQAAPSTQPHKTQAQEAGATALRTGKGGNEAVRKWGMACMLARMTSHPPTLNEPPHCTGKFKLK